MGEFTIYIWSLHQLTNRPITNNLRLNIVSSQNTGQLFVFMYIVTCKTTAETSGSVINARMGFA